jgi:hypothetical protein
MIGELTDKEILEFLMTSDFQENLSPDELRFLLLKFRNYYRVSLSKNDLIYSELEVYKKNAQSIDVFNQKIKELSDQNSNLSDKINTIMNKKLSIKERLFGKILNNK